MAQAYVEGTSGGVAFSGKGITIQEVVNSGGLAYFNLTPVEQQEYYSVYQEGMKQLWQQRSEKGAEEIDLTVPMFVQQGFTLPTKIDPKIIIGSVGLLLVLLLKK